MTRKLRSVDVPMIFDLKRRGHAYAEIGRIFHVSRSTIKSILKGKSYKAQSLPLLHESH